MSPNGRLGLPRWLTDLAWRIILLAAFLAVWEGLVITGGLKEIWVSRPTKIFEWAITDIPTAEFMRHLWVTTRETFIGLLLGSLFGVLSGFLLSLSPALYRITEPFIMALYSLPRVALAPLFIVWFGIGEASKVALAASLVFFVMLFNAHEGVRGASQDHINAVKTMGGSRFFIYRKVILPSSMPLLMSGLRVSLGLSLIGVIVGEMLAAREGLGQVIAYGASVFQTDVVFGVIGVLAVMALVANTMLAQLEAKVLSWRAGVNV